ncbi:ubiquitin carboxyl-terminal hydrolase 15-like isoform X2 [Cimex lectularius]|uniref:ubiquitinyl hydrolase 1 n=1 Tax=Cimex lectularius TaxID=79782 RepID=A0A8I6TFN4_CIMLE|nr:ubiquitin carboxyl-terminal hydrolase 15-like isoform X2 [Cimex lectularius]
MECDVGILVEDESDDSVSEIFLVSKTIKSYVCEDEEDDFFDIESTPAINLRDLNTWNDNNVDIKFLDMSKDATSSAFENCIPIFPTDICPEDDIEGVSLRPGMGEAGVCGLWNLGNTCFMSAGVQCLMATAPIVSTLLNAQIPPHQSLTIGLADLAKTMWSGKQHSVLPADFKNSLAKHFPQFNDYRQHDCQEFLALLLNGLHEQLNTALKNKLCCKNQDESFEEGNDMKKINFCEQAQSTSSKSEVLGFVSCTESRMSEKETFNNSIVNKFSAKKTVVNNLAEMNNKGLAHIEKCDSKNCDKQLNNICTGSSPENKIILNNTIRPFTGLEDIIKEPSPVDSKNVLVTEEEANNELRFDSEKYPRTDNLIRNTNSFQLYENNTSGKRCKTTVTHFSNPAELKEGLDLKRVKLNSSSSDEEKNTKIEKERQKLGEQFMLEKNQRMECERKEDKFKGKGEGSSFETSNSSNLSFEASGELDADKHWQDHLSSNRSVIVETFQGQFKSTVICATCQFVSVTYEPFMYLSVPLPNAMQKIINVTYVSDSKKNPRVYTLEMNRYCDSIATLKDRLVNDLDGESSNSIIIAEVFQHHISKLLDDNYLIRHLNHSDRYLYAFKKIILKDEGKDIYIDPKNEDTLADNHCIICLEDVHSNMKQHKGCSCILCESCITASLQHYGSSLKCPVCHQCILLEDLYPIKMDKQITTRMLNVPLVFRVDTVGDGNNNQKAVQLFGHPKLLRLPNLCPRDSLKQTIASITPYSEPYRLLLVEGKGDRCSRCMFNAHCHGCEVNGDDQIQLKYGDTLALSFSSPVDSSHESSLNDKQVEDSQPMLTLNDCIQSFSKSELLDSSNPWYCPHCRENRCATKTLTVWRYPDYLIVYLKRFVFHNQISTKLKEKVLFPLTGLSFASCSYSYDLYACVCHIGGVSSGHYTSYTQHPHTGEWHYFNDNEFVKQCPQDEDYSNAYILFYKKQGVKTPAFDPEDINLAIPAQKKEKKKL